jgi:hypothetical protein
LYCVYRANKYQYPYFGWKILAETTTVVPHTNLLHNGESLMDECIALSVDVGGTEDGGIREFIPKRRNAAAYRTSRDNVTCDKGPVSRDRLSAETIGSYTALFRPKQSAAHLDQTF